MTPAKRRFWARVYREADRAEEMIADGFSLGDVREEMQRILPTNELKSTLRLLASRSVGDWTA